MPPVKRSVKRNGPRPSVRSLRNDPARYGSCLFVEIPTRRRSGLLRDDVLTFEPAIGNDDNFLAVPQKSHVEELKKACKAEKRPSHERDILETDNCRPLADFQTVSQVKRDGGKPELTW